MLVLGVMTGTSLDGLDAVCVEVAGNGLSPEWRVRWQQSLPYPSALRASVLALQRPGAKTSLSDFLALDARLGRWFATSTASLLAHNAVKPDVIANHGQTVAHHPELGATLQLGDPARIAEATGLTVVSHFREGDMAAHGQGAPLLPLIHGLLARKLAPDSPIAIHNLGGISNLTYIPPGHSNQTGQNRLLAFDTGPSNIWIDEAVSIATRGKKKFDSRGRLARKGKPDPRAVERILAMPYFRKRPPKSTGRDDFPFSLLRRVTRARGEDLVATATEVTIESIARAYEVFILAQGLPLEEIYLAGGGAKNDFLRERLSSRLAPIRVRTLADSSQELGEQALEPLGFALFGYFSLLGRALGGSWTGARSFGPPGWITPGRNWASVLAQLRSESNF